MKPLADLPVLEHPPIRHLAQLQGEGQQVPKLLRVLRRAITAKRVEMVQHPAHPPSVSHATRSKGAE